MIYSSDEELCRSCVLPEEAAGFGGPSELSVIVEYSVGMNGLVCESTLQEVDARIDVERTYATDPERPILFVWVTCDDLSAFEAALAEDQTVDDFQPLSTVDGRRLYRLQVSDETETVLYPAWVSLGAEGLEAHCENGRWHSRVRFPDRDALAEYEAYLTGNDLSFEVKRLYDAASVPGTSGAKAEDGLTAQQRQTLLLAYERGFFDIPRRATAAELATELEVSRQAVSERLRRGYATLVERYLL